MRSQVRLAWRGGVKLGNRVILAGQTGITNQVKIGDGAMTSAQTGIHSDVAPGEVVCGSPAIPYKLYLKVCAVYSRLPDMYQSLKQLQRKFKDSPGDPVGEVKSQN